MSRPPAPGSLERVRQFINTLDLDADRDAFRAPDDARAWLTKHGLSASGDLDGAGLGRLVAFREDLRQLIAARSESLAVADDTLRSLAQFAQLAPLTVGFGPDGNARLEPARGSDAAMAALFVDVATAVGGGSWARLKVCANDACQWAFWDASRNRSGVWCTMAVCGNRMKGRAFRARARRGAQAKQSGSATHRAPA